MLFAERMGCLNDNPPDRTNKFIDATDKVFQLIAQLMFGFPVWQYWPTPTYRQFEKYENDLIEIGETIMAEVRVYKIGHSIMTDVRVYKINCSQYHGRGKGL